MIFTVKIENVMQLSNSHVNVTKDKCEMDKCVITCYGSGRLNFY